MELTHELKFTVIVMHSTTKNVKIVFNRYINTFVTKYRSRALKSRGSYGNSALFLKRSQYISLDFYVLRKTQNGKCGS